MTSIADDDVDDLGPVPAVSPDLLAMGFAVIQSHFKTPDSEVLMPGDLLDVLDDVKEALSLDGETTVAVFRRVCAGLNYLADRQLDGLPPLAKPFADPIFCAAAARCRCGGNRARRWLGAPLRRCSAGRPAPR